MKVKFTEKARAIAKDIAKATDKNSPAILTGLAVVGLATTAIMCWKAAPKANKVMEDHSGSISLLKSETVTPEVKTQIVKDVVTEMAPIVLPPVIMGLATGACIIGSNRISAKRITALSTAYALAEKASSTYADKVEELVNPKKMKEIKEGIAQDKLDSVKLTDNYIIETSTGTTLFFDDASGRYFHAGVEAVNRAYKTISDRQEYEQWISLNELYYELNLPFTTAGDLLGFDRESGHIDIGDMTKVSDDGTPCRVLMFNLRPNPNYFSETC